MEKDGKSRVYFQSGEIAYPEYRSRFKGRGNRGETDFRALNSESFKRGPNNSFGEKTRSEWSISGCGRCGNHQSVRLDKTGHEFNFEFLVNYLQGISGLTDLTIEVF